jgi:hypothetical protein
MASSSTALGDHHREMINQDADQALSDSPKGDRAARAAIEAQRSEQLAEIDDWELRKAQRRAEVWHLNNVSEKDVADRIASIRNDQAHIDQFKLDQMTANGWISFERAVSCLTGQKDLATASDARRTLLDALCAGKFHSGNPKAVQCLDASSRDDWHWSVSDFRTLVERHEGLESVLKNTYFERNSLLRWIKGCGFEPTADIQGEPLEPGDQLEATFRELPKRRPGSGRKAEVLVYDLLLAKHPNRKIPRIKFEAIRDYAQGLLAEQINRGISLEPNLRTIGIDAVRRAFGKKL